MDGDDELARLQQFRVGACPAVGTPEDRVVMQVKGKPMIRTGFDVLQMPPAAVSPRISSSGTMPKNGASRMPEINERMFVRSKSAISRS